ncbi:MAG TPA: ABC transporter permease [Methylomirabilota bacterium]|nr:ABC transporter permease [Methylomirabilota bacterium]
MLLRLLGRSLRERRGHVALALFTVAVGAALVSALLGVAFAVSERMAKELRAFGANIVVLPRAEPLEVPLGSLRYVAPQEEAFLDEADLPRLKTIFWRHNIIAIVPFLSRAVEFRGARALFVGTWFQRELQIPEGKRQFFFASGSRREVASLDGRWTTGLRNLAASWEVKGAWPAEGSGAALVGRALASRFGVTPGETIELKVEGKSVRFPVTGILKTGGEEEDQIFAELATVQAILGLPGKVDKVRVSALVTADNALALRTRKIGAERLPPEEYERWYCTPYLDSIIFQIEEALPNAKAKAVRQVADAERAFLDKVSLTFALVGIVGLTASVLGVMAAVARALLERRTEVGLMKALGGDGRQIASLFFLEAGVTGVGGGALGYLLGAALARMIGLWVFETPIVLHPLLLPGTLGVAVVIALLGTLAPVRGALRLSAVATLRGG